MYEKNFYLYLILIYIKCVLDFFQIYLDKIRKHDIIEKSYLLERIYYYGKL